MYNFSVDYNVIDNRNIHKYLMKKTRYKIMFGFIKKMFIRLLTSITLNMITGINESKELTRHISRKCEYKFDRRKYNSNQKWNDDKWMQKKKNMCVKNIAFGILLHGVVKMGSM